MLPHETRNDVETRSRSEISRLQERVETLTRERDEAKQAAFLENAERKNANSIARTAEARAEAAEAERDRLREALEPFAEAWDVAVHHEDLVRHLTLGQLGELAAHEVSGAHFRRARAALQKEPQP